jgi:Predicted membrane protein (DUF2207)
LFDDRDAVTLSQLKNTFGRDLGRVRQQLYADMLEQGWYRRSPAATRSGALGLAVLALLGSGAVAALLAVFTGFGLIGAGLSVGALVLLAVAPRFPARTGKGSAALARIQGFRLYIATAEAAQIRFQEREQIFSEFLPYAMVFGLADRWAGIFADIGGAGPDGTGGLYWYTGGPGWTIGAFNGYLRGFTSSTSGAISSIPPGVSGGSGFSGGFSGGGGGGGGGGSW